jgi:hypothetical protein
MIGRAAELVCEASVNMVGNASELASRLKLLSAHGLDVEFVECFIGHDGSVVVSTEVMYQRTLNAPGTRRTNRTTPIVKCLR